MTENQKYEQSIKNKNEKTIINNFSQQSNPMDSSNNDLNVTLNDYSQTVPRKKYDKDINDIIEIVRILNNMAPVRMPEYNFNIDEINGERYYKPDGTLLLVREYDSDVIRDYYASHTCKDDEFSVSRILEHEKKSGRLRTKIEPITRKGSRLKTNITIFDLKVNNKLVFILQL